VGSDNLASLILYKRLRWEVQRIDEDSFSVWTESAGRPPAKGKADP
jgi:hypothetical protein